MSGAIGTRRSDIPRVASQQLDDGCRVEAGFLGAAERLFGVTHLPSGTATRGVVICTPLHNDQLKNNRREVVLSRQLAASGMAIQRFHYTGTGNSAGRHEDLTVETMIEDTRAAAAHLEDAAGTSDLVFMGTKMGCLAAAAVAAERRAPLVLWEPVDGERYIRDLFRTARIIEMNSEMTSLSTAQRIEQLEQAGSVDIAGFTLTNELRSDALSRTMTDAVGEGTAPIFLAEFSEKPELRANTAALVEQWQSGGRSVSAHVVPVAEAWQLFVYGFRAEERQDAIVELLDATATWIEAR